MHGSHWWRHPVAATWWQSDTPPGDRSPNRNPSEGSRSSPERTRPLPLTGSLAPAGVGGSHAAAGSVPRARRSSDRRRHGPLYAPTAPPSCGSTAPSVRTRVPAPPVYVRHVPTPPSDGGTPVGRLVCSWTSWTPRTQLVRCPQNRGNFSPSLKPRVGFAPPILEDDILERPAAQRPEPTHRPADRQDRVGMDARRQAENRVDFFPVAGVPR